MSKTGLERFTEKYEVDPDTGCWNWTASLFAAGYAQFRFTPERNGRAHTWAYDHFIGPIPEGLELDHLCRNKICVNPAHLEAVTTRENILRSNNAAALNARKTHCKRGHDFTPENTYRNTRGGRVCRTCQAAAQKAWNATHRERGVQYQQDYLQRDPANLERRRAYAREYARKKRERLRGAASPS